MKKREIPNGIKIIAVLYYIGAILLISNVLFSLIITRGNFSEIGKVLIFQQFELDDSILSLIGIAAILGSVIFSILWIFVGKGLWKGKNWTRIFTIIVACLGIISTLFIIFLEALDSFPEGVSFSNLIEIIVISIFLYGIYIAAPLVIALYLLFNRKVKEFFKFKDNKEQV